MAQTQTADATDQLVDRRQRRDDTAAINSRVMEALERDKREGLKLAVKGRWTALAIIAVLFVYLNPSWEMLYYHVLLLGFAAIGWLQFRIGRVGHSKAELFLMFCDLALMTIAVTVPNPFASDDWPVAMQYRFNNFSYFYVLLAGATLAYSWRTIFAVGTWTSGMWIVAMIIILLQPPLLPEASVKVQAALAEYPQLLEFLDPHDVNVPGRVQEIVIFLIVAGILAMGGRRTNALLMRQAEATRERTNLARYFPPNIVDQLADRDQPLGTVRDQRVAVMFADIVGFTRLAEHMTADETVATLREFHARLEDCVFDNGGTLDKYLGDGVMATFGTPDVGPDDAARALQCARDMLDTMDEWNRERAATGRPPIALSLGLHYGPVVLGDIGSTRRLEFAVLGDAVNVASRLEAMTRELGVRLAVSGDLVAEIDRANGADTNLLAGLTDAGRRSLRGRDEAVAVWTA
jgi:adenylate cyclase